MFLEHEKKITAYIRTIINSNIHSLIVLGEAGIGKTYITGKTLKELGLREEVNFISINSYITPLELFKILQRVNQLEYPKLLILDDVETILKDKKIINLLKSALWEQPNSVRKINYQSSSYLLRNTSGTINEFEGKIIFLLNEIGNNAMIESLISRGLFYNFSPSENEIKQAILEIAKNIPYRNLEKEERVSIANFLLQKSGIKNIRSLLKAYALYYVNGSNEWKQLL